MDNKTRLLKIAQYQVSLMSSDYLFSTGHVFISLLTIEATKEILRMNVYVNETSKRSRRV